MFKFFRRLFILLILFAVIFLIFRFARPEATSRFVEKVKSIPHTISSWFKRSKNPEILINGETAAMSGDIYHGDNYEYDGQIVDQIGGDDFVLNGSDQTEPDPSVGNQPDDNVSGLESSGEQDLSNLEEILLGSGNSNISDNTVVNTGVSQIQNTGNTTNVDNNAVVNTGSSQVQPANTSTPKTNQNVQKKQVVDYGCGVGFSQQDCENMKNELGNFD